MRFNSVNVSIKFEHESIKSALPTWSTNPARQVSVPGRALCDRPSSARLPSGLSTSIMTTGSVRG